MPAPLSNDLRPRIVRAVEGGVEVSSSMAVKLMRRLRETGSMAPARYGGHRRPVLEPHTNLLPALVDEKSSTMLAELQAASAARGIRVAALSTILLMLRRLGLSHKRTKG